MASWTRQEIRLRDPAALAQSRWAVKPESALKDWETMHGGRAKFPPNPLSLEIGLGGFAAGFHPCTTRFL